MDIQWPLALFSTLAGCGGIVFAFVGTSELLEWGKKTRFNASVVSLVLMVVGGCASVLHLEQKANIMAAAANVFSFSGISLELIFLGLTVVFAAAYAVAVKRSASKSATRVLAVLGLVSGVILSFVVGHGYLMESQQYWNTLSLPISYVGSALACGSAVYGATMVFSQDDDADVARIARCSLACAVIALVTFVAYDAVIGFVLDAVWFWGIAVVLGCVAAGALCGAAAKRPALLYGAAVCALAGGVGLRAAMFLVGYGYFDAFGLAASRAILGV